MKRQILLSLLLTFSMLVSYSTPYKSVLNNGIAKWSIIVLPDYEESIEWITTSNVQLNNNIYRALYQYTTYYNGIGIPNNEVIDAYWKDYTPNQYVCNEQYYIRESADTAKLYIYDKDKNVEYLISDMNLGIGDTFILPGNSKEYLQTETDYAIVDSVYVLNGNKHIELNVKSTIFDRKLTFIEGVGPNLGIFYFKGGTSLNPDYFCLNCFYNGFSFHKELQDRGCFETVTNGLNDFPSDYYDIKHQLYSVEISFSENSTRNIQLYSLSGQLIFKSNNIATSNILIPRNNLSNGVFILKIEDLRTKKIIIQKLIL